MLTYDYKAMSLELFTRVYDALKMAQDEAFMGVLANIGIDVPEAMTDYQRTEITGQAAFVLTCEIVGGAYAVMDEWGTGSKMDLTNPALSDYMDSELWNRYRYGPAIRTRERGPYTNIFGQQDYSEATRPGVNLEELARRYPERDFNIRVIEPSHALQNEMSYMKAGRFEEIMMNVMAEFPWGRFIRTDVS